MMSEPKAKIDESLGRAINAYARQYELNFDRYAMLGDGIVVAIERSQTLFIFFAADDWNVLNAVQCKGDIQFQMKLPTQGKEANGPHKFSLGVLNRVNVKTFMVSNLASALVFVRIFFKSASGKRIFGQPVIVEN